MINPLHKTDEFTRPLAKAGQISVGFFCKGSVSLREMGDAWRKSAEVRTKRDTRMTFGAINIDREHPHSILLTPHDAGVIRDSVDNESYSTRKELKGGDLPLIHRLSTR